MHVSRHSSQHLSAPNFLISSSEEDWPCEELKPTLQVFMAKKGDLFKALLTLPNFIVCLLRLKPNAPRPDDGYVRFEWCGRQDRLDYSGRRQEEGEIQPPSSDNVGWLKMHKSEGRVKGLIQTPYGHFSFHGPRVDVEDPEIECEWEDFSYEAYEYAGGRAGDTM
jgi:hypothetical protein